ncbi:hypothetical protein E2542_SST11216 [Spatholobus suberectus]|nr:hypothetical protein E2542_SST11216 [Spatholobus suberectus]
MHRHWNCGKLNPVACTLGQINTLQDNNNCCCSLSSNVALMYTPQLLGLLGLLELYMDPSMVDLMIEHANAAFHILQVVFKMLSESL